MNNGHGQGHGGGNVQNSKGMESVDRGLKSGPGTPVEQQLRLVIVKLCMIGMMGGFTITAIAIYANIVPIICGGVFLFLFSGSHYVFCKVKWARGINESIEPTREFSKSNIRSSND